MKIVTNSNRKAAPTLAQFLNQCDCTRDAPTFRMQGSTYCVIAPKQNRDVEYKPHPSTYECPDDFIACFNLSCHTVRAVHVNSQVQPLCVEIHARTKDGQDPVC